MGKYTVTLNYLLKNNYNIWNFEDVVESYFDDNFTAEKWESLKTLFEQKYLYYEIGNETIEIWQHYLKTNFMERIHTYKNMLALLVKLNEQDPMCEYSNSETQHVDNAILPYSSNGVLGNVSDMQNATRQSSGRNISAIDLFDNYARKIRDLDDEFIAGFAKNFMEVY